jgi:hypothetical protein
VTIELSAGGGLNDLLRRTSAAVAVSSTVFLACIQQGIPVIGQDCYPVAWRQMLGGAVSFTRSSEEAAAAALAATGVDPARFSRLLASLAPGVPVE